MIHRGLTEEQYNLLEGVRSSHLKKVLQSQAHYLHAINNPSEQTEAMKLGTMIHMAILEPARFKETVVVTPDFGDMRSKTNREKRDAWISDNPEKTCISSDDSYVIAGICNALTKKKSFLKLIEENELEKEVSFQGQVGNTKTKCRADAIDIKKRVIVDIKSTKSATPEAMQYYVRDYGVDIQQAFYVATIEKALGSSSFSWENWSSVIVAVEKSAPFESQVFEFPTHELVLAFKDVLLALNLIEEAKQSGVYRGYPDIRLPLTRYRSHNEYLDSQIGG